MVNPARRPQTRFGLRHYAPLQASNLHLVCFPWAGAGASAYHALAQHMARDTHVWSVQYAGREERISEPPLVDMTMQALQIMRSMSCLLSQAHAGERVVFFGHSMGALLALEVAQMLHARGAGHPDLLIASGAGAPHTKSSHVRPSSGANDEDFIGDLRRLGGTPEHVLNDDALMRALLPAFRADYAALDGYRFDWPTPLQCPIVVCAGEADDSVTEEGLSAWRNHTRSDVHLQRLQGDHFFPKTYPAELAEHITRWTRSYGPNDSLRDGDVAPHQVHST